MNLIQTRGFSLGSISLSESDKLVQLYTLQWGRVKAVVRGARRPRSKLAPALDLFTESAFSLHKRAHSELYILTQAKVLNSHSELKKDLASITALQVLADILVQSLHDTEFHSEVFTLIRETLEEMKRGTEGQEAVLTAFGMKFLVLLGYPLELGSCSECGASLGRKTVLLIPHRGGALCSECCPAAASRLKVGPAALEILKRLRALPMGKIHILKMKPAFSRAIFLTLLEYLERTMEKKLKTLEYYLSVSSKF